MTALASRDIGDMPGLSGPDTRHSDWVQHCEQHANEHTLELAERCMADPAWLHALAASGELVEETDDLPLMRSNPSEYVSRIDRKLRAVALDRAYQHLLHEAMDQRRFRHADESELTWQRPVKRGDVTYMETCFV